MENKKKLSTFKKIMVTVGLTVIAIFIALQDVHGYDSSNQGANVVDKWGYFHFNHQRQTYKLEYRVHPVRGGIHFEITQQHGQQASIVEPTIIMFVFLMALKV